MKRQVSAITIECTKCVDWGVECTKCVDWGVECTKCVDQGVECTCLFLHQLR